MVDRLQVIGEGLLILVRHVFQRVAHHMHDAPLVFCQRIRRRYGFPDTAQAIRTDHENVQYAAVFQLIEYAQPEFCTFILADRDAQNFLAPFLVDAENHIRRRFANYIVFPHIEHHGVNVYDGIYRAQRPLLPRLNFRQQLVRNGRNHPFADLEPVDVLDLLRNLRYAHPACIHRDDLSLDLADVLFILWHHLRLEVAVSVLRYLDGDFPHARTQRLMFVAIPAVVIFRILFFPIFHLLFQFRLQHILDRPAQQVF